MIERCKPMVMFERKKFWKTRYGDENPAVVLEWFGYREMFRAPLDTIMVAK